MWNRNEMRRFAIGFLAIVLAFAGAAGAQPTVQAVPRVVAAGQQPRDLRVYYDNAEGRVVELGPNQSLPLDDRREFQVWLEAWDASGKQWPQSELKYQVATDDHCAGRYDIQPITPHRFRVRVLGEDVSGCGLYARLISPTTLERLLNVAVSSVTPAAPCPRGGEAVPCELRAFYDNPEGRVVPLTDKRLPISRQRDVQVWVETWTQYGKQWPQDRLKYQLGTERCPGRYEISDVTPHRFRVHVLSDQADECKLELRLVSPRAVTLQLEPWWETPPVPAPLPGEVYNRADADYIVRRIYQGLLQREPDEGGYAAALADVQAGRVDTVILKMVQSPEYAQLHRGWNTYQTVQSLYAGILGRPADAEGLWAYQSRVARGETAAVALELLRSQEFSERMAARR